MRDDIFQRTCTSIGAGVFENRTDIVLHHFVLDRDAVVETRVGEQVVRSGAWVMEGVAGEVWSAPRATARKTFERL